MSMKLAVIADGLAIVDESKNTLIAFGPEPGQASICTKEGQFDAVADYNERVKLLKEVVDIYNAACESGLLMQMGRKFFIQR